MATAGNSLEIFTLNSFVLDLGESI